MLLNLYDRPLARIRSLNQNPESQGRKYEEEEEEFVLNYILGTSTTINSI